jgi:hypothetical protein
LKVPVKPLLVSISLFLLLGVTALSLAFMYLTDQTPDAAINSLLREGKLFLFQHGMVEKLAPDEITRLYQSTCTRQCHGRDVIEKKPRTAAEWESVVARMRAPDRADISDRHAETITRHLQNNFLSNVPTVIPEKTMKFVKQHLWRSDFGENDLFLDIIYVPREHQRLMPYLGVRNLPRDQQDARFIVFINTHQGTVPPWNLAEMSTLRINGGSPQNATGWTVLYRDGQQHHNQGMLTFPAVDDGQPADLEITMQLAGLGRRTFQWNLPVPQLPE